MPKGRDEEKIQKVLNIYDKYNVRNIVTDLMTKYYEDSLKNLDEVNVPEERKQVLRDYAAYLYTRNK
jgi:geranylgeranyl diphosphate synthase type II